MTPSMGKFLRDIAIAFIGGGGLPYIGLAALIVGGYLFGGQLIVLLGGGVEQNSRSNEIIVENARTVEIFVACNSPYSEPIGGSCAINPPFVGNGQPGIKKAAFGEKEGQKGYFCEWSKGVYSSADFVFRGKATVSCVKPGIVHVGTQQ